MFQNVYLFEDTIENNIKFGRLDATREDVIEAAKKACCHEFISALPEGYHTLVGEGGASLSGGGAPAHFYCPGHLKGCADYHLDEATASVDPENERELQAAIAELTKDKTIIMIAHRLSTVRNADQILVLDKGRIVQRGTHRGTDGRTGAVPPFYSDAGDGNRLEPWKKRKSCRQMIKRKIRRKFQ